MHLFQHLVDIDGVGFFPFLGPLLVVLRDVLGGLTGLLGSLSGGFGGHVDTLVLTVELIKCLCLAAVFI